MYISPSVVIISFVPLLGFANVGIFLAFMAAICDWISTGIACCDIASKPRSVTFVHADRGGGPRAWWLCTRRYGDLFILQCTYVLCAYINGWTNMLQLRLCSATQYFRRMTLVFMKRSAFPQHYGAHELVGRHLNTYCLLADWRTVVTNCVPRSVKRNVGISRSTIELSKNRFFLREVKVLNAGMGRNIFG